MSEPTGDAAAFRRVLDDRRIAQQNVGSRGFFRKSKIKKLKTEIVSKRGQNKVLEAVATDERAGRATAVMALSGMVGNLQTLKRWASEHAPETEAKMRALGLWDIQSWDDA